MSCSRLELTKRGTSKWFWSRVKKNKTHSSKVILQSEAGLPSRPQLGLTLLCSKLHIFSPVADTDDQYQPQGHWCPTETHSGGSYPEESSFPEQKDICTASPRWHIAWTCLFSNPNPKIFLFVHGHQNFRKASYCLWSSSSIFPFSSLT